MKFGVLCFVGEKCKCLVYQRRDLLSMLHSCAIVLHSCAMDVVQLCIFIGVKKVKNQLIVEVTLFIHS